MRVMIDSKDSNLVQRKFFEHRAGQANIAFLMRDSQINYEALQEYIDVLEHRFVELELLKSEISKKYEPNELQGKPYNYEFDFENEAIVYTAADEKEAD